MTIDTWFTFVFTASLVLAIPGPTIVYVVGKSLSHGKKACAPLTAGVVLGDAVCILFSLLGLSTLLLVSSAAFGFLKILGAAYLIYLGLDMFRSGLQTVKPNSSQQLFSAKQLFQRVFMVTILNPKIILFHAAFLPQFVNQDGDVVSQLITLSCTFLVLALVNILCYSLLAGKFAGVLGSGIFNRWYSVVGGAGLVGAGVAAIGMERK